MAIVENKLTGDKLKSYVHNKEVDFAFQYGGKLSRRLTVLLRGGFRVYKDDEVILTTDSPEEAINLYNSLESK